MGPEPSSLFSDRDSALLMAGLGGCLTSYALFSSVFGDGYYEMQRHAVGVTIGLIFQLSALVMLPAAEHRRGSVTVMQHDQVSGTAAARAQAPDVA
jgi:hypothetical protein